MFCLWETEEGVGMMGYVLIESIASCTIDGTTAEPEE
jgi:hypothetical protein